MEVINCTWELNNLNKRTCEIILEEENIDIQHLSKIQSNYDYIVIKIPSSNVRICQILSNLGFYFIETQISLHFKINKMQTLNKTAQYYLPKLSLVPCDDTPSIENVINHISADMFSTDRIALDCHFGIEMSNNRYRNWIRNTISIGNYKLFNIKVSSMIVGFCYLKILEDGVDYVLGGLYPEYQGHGLGLAESLSACRYIKMNGLNFVDATVSSNNINVLRCFMDCGYSIERFKYVFTKVIR